MFRSPDDSDRLKLPLGRANRIAILKQLFAVDSGGNQSKNTSGDMKYETDAVHLEPKDWETRVDAYDSARGKALGRDLQQILQSKNTCPQERGENSISASVNAAEIVAVIEGRKPLFHEQYGEISDKYAAAIRCYTPRGIVTESFDGHVVVYRPDVVAKILDSDSAFYRPENETDHAAIVNAVQCHAMGELMGYGSRFLLEKGSVLVRIFDDDIPIAGFYSPSATVFIFAEARLADYERYFGKTLTVHIAGSGLTSTYSVNRMRWNQ